MLNERAGSRVGQAGKRMSEAPYLNVCVRSRMGACSSEKGGGEMRTQTCEFEILNFGCELEPEVVMNQGCGSRVWCAAGLGVMDLCATPWLPQQLQATRHKSLANYLTTAPLKSMPSTPAPPPLLATHPPLALISSAPSCT